MQPCPRLVDTTRVASDPTSRSVFASVGLGRCNMFGVCFPDWCLACRFVVLVIGTVVYGRGDDQHVESHKATLHSEQPHLRWRGTPSSPPPPPTPLHVTLHILPCLSEDGNACASELPLHLLACICSHTLLLIACMYVMQYMVAMRGILLHPGPVHLMFSPKSACL